MTSTDKKAVILLSGGLDSATCLAIAKAKGYQCHTLAFDYGQRGQAELDASKALSSCLGAASHRVIKLGLGTIGGSALTDSRIDVPESAAAGVPVTYVPARNTVFLSLALGLAEVVEAEAIYIGVNAVDYSGYPDCRPGFIDAFQRLASVATVAGIEGHAPRIETPLQDLSKAEIIQVGTRLGLDYSLTVSCYQPDARGLACGKCDSCRLRRQGFMDAKLTDSTRYSTTG